MSEIEPAPLHESKYKSLIQHGIYRKYLNMVHILATLVIEMEIKFQNDVLKAAHGANLKYQRPQKQTDYIPWDRLEISATSEINELHI